MIYTTVKIQINQVNVLRGFCDKLNPLSYEIEFATFHLTQLDRKGLTFNKCCINLTFLFLEYLAFQLLPENYITTGPYEY